MGNSELTELHFSYSDQMARKNKKSVKLFVSLICFALLSIAVCTSVITTAKNNSKLSDNSSISQTPLNKSTNPNSNPSDAGGSQAAVKPANTFIKKSAQAPNCIPQLSVTKPAPVVINPNITGLQQSNLLVNNYTVYGNTATEVNNQINKCSPVTLNGQRFAASTDYRLNWAFNYIANEQGTCELSQVRVGLAISETLPFWQGSANADKNLSSAWASYITSLTLHENGHVNIDRNYANKLLTELQNFPATSCDAIGTAATNRANEIVAELNNANDYYDNSTSHGATQGAVLNR